ncbi:MAG: CHAT domain-containing protein [Hylemonella sp.]|nr:CHAT domain-containing protein [Hylemonella sp.]
MYASVEQTGPINDVACLRELEPVRVLALDIDETRRDFVYYYALCKFAEGAPDRAGLTEPEFRAWYEQVLRARRLPPTHPGGGWVDLKSEHDYLRLGQILGLSDEVEARFHTVLRERIARATAQPPDAVANDELLAFAKASLGSWQFQAQVVRTQQVLEQGLGASHRASLVLLRAAAYHERYLGRAQQALAYIARAAELTQLHHPQDSLLQAHMATEWAACLSSAGRTAEAIPKLLQAREFFEGQQPVQWSNIVRTNYNLAGIALDIGDYDGAIGYAQRSIGYINRSNDELLTKYEIVVPATITEVAKLSQGDVGAAERLKAALQIPLGPEMHIGSQAFALVRDALRRNDAEMLKWATAFTDRHIHLFRAPLQAESALRPLMQAWQEAGVALADPKVREPLERALTIGLGGRNPATAALTQFSMARHLSATNPGAAIWLYKRAGNLLQQIRQGLPSDDQDLYRSWLANYEDELRTFTALLIDEGRLPEAEQVLSLLRDEELFEYTRRSKARRSGATSALSFTPAEQAANPALDQLAQEAELAARAAHARLDALRRVELRTTYRDSDAEESVKAIQARLHDLLDTAVPVPAPGSRAEPASEAGAVGVPRHTARLTYLLGRDSLDIIVGVGRGSFRHRVAVKAAELHHQIQAARGALANSQVEPSVPLQQLWAWLIEPVLPRLRQAKVQRLLLVPDGALRYLPFAALFDGKRYLVQQFALQTLLTGARQAALPIPARPDLRGTSVLAVGRTVGDGEHSALPGVARELSAIRMPQSRVLVDEAFTSASLREGLQRRPGIVHVASHFVLDPAGEDKSYLLLGNGQRLSLSELKLLPWSGVRLALLSACDSAVSLGKGDGREWMGFAASLSGAGVSDVMATLWRIDDAATASWMNGFYGQLRAATTAQPSSATLAHAQRAWLQRYRGGNLAHPHYWAAFVWLTT